MVQTQSDQTIDDLFWTYYLALGDCQGMVRIEAKRVGDYTQYTVFEGNGHCGDISLKPSDPTEVLNQLRTSTPSKYQSRITGGAGEKLFLTATPIRKQ
jgi:hypothetical protein